MVDLSLDIQQYKKNTKKSQNFYNEYVNDYEIENTKEIKNDFYVSMCSYNEFLCDKASEVLLINGKKISVKIKNNDFNVLISEPHHIIPRWLLKSYYTNAEDEDKKVDSFHDKRNTNLVCSSHHIKSYSKDNAIEVYKNSLSLDIKKLFPNCKRMEFMENIMLFYKQKPKDPENFQERCNIKLLIDRLLYRNDEILQDIIDNIYSKESTILFNTLTNDIYYYLASLPTKGENQELVALMKANLKSLNKLDL